MEEAGLGSLKHKRAREHTHTVYIYMYCYVIGIYYIYVYTHAYVYLNVIFIQYLKYLHSALYFKSISIRLTTYDVIPMMTL